jgi:hypothetical protein
MLKELSQKEYVIKGITKLVKSNFRIIEILLSRNDSLKYQLISYFCFDIYLYYLYLFRDAAKLSKLENFINCNSIFNIRYDHIR